MLASFGELLLVVIGTEYSFAKDFRICRTIHRLMSQQSG